MGDDKMKIGLFVGSFNPWHQGHQEILNKAEKIFDKIIIAQGYNPEKEVPSYQGLDGFGDNIIYDQFTGLLVDYIDSLKLNNLTPTALIKGLRNAQDLEYETCMQYTNEDLGLDLPVFYVICDRKLRHVSSSQIRSLEKFKK